MDIWVSAGASRPVWVQVQDVTGISIAGLPLQLGLGSYDVAPSSWRAPTAEATTGDPTLRLVSYQIDDTVPVGEYVMWVNLFDAANNDRDIAPVNPPVQIRVR